MNIPSPQPSPRHVEDMLRMMGERGVTCTNPRASAAAAADA